MEREWGGMYYIRVTKGDVGGGGVLPIVLKRNCALSAM